MGKRCADGASGFGHSAGAKILYRVEGVAAGLEEDADAVDDMVGAFDGAIDRLAVAQIRLTKEIWPTPPIGCRKPARSGRRTATRMR